MHLANVLAVALATTTVTMAIPVPIQVAYFEAPDAAKPETVTGGQNIANAVASANSQIQNMDTTLTAAMQNQNGHEADLVRQAFGPQAFTPDNIAQIRKTVDSMQSTRNEHRLRVQTPSGDAADQVRFEREKASAQDKWDKASAADRQRLRLKDPATIQKRPTLAQTITDRQNGQFQGTGNVLLGSNFHAIPSDRARGGIVIHEFAHQQQLAGDDVIKASGQIIKLDERPNVSASGVTKEGGYARSDQRNIRTEADLSAEYKAVRDSSPNMAWNADSYRAFAGLCSPPKLRKRALLEEDPVAWYLAKRQQCELPPDYFEKKAAARAAAAAKEKAATATPKDAKKASLQSAAAKLKAANAFKQGVKSKQPTSTTAKSLKDAKKPTLKSAATKLKAASALQKGAKSKGSNKVKGSAGKSALGRKGPNKVKGPAGKSALGRKGPNKVKGPAGKAGKSTVGRKGSKVPAGRKGAKKAGAKTPKGKVSKSPKKKTTTRGVARKGGQATKAKAGGRAKATGGKTTKAAGKKAGPSKGKKAVTPKAPKGKKAVARKATRGGSSKGRAAKPAKKATAPKRTQTAASRAAVKKGPTPKAQVVTSKAIKKGGKSRRSLLDELD